MRPFHKEGLEEMALSRPNGHEVLQPSLGSGYPVYQIGATKCYLCIEENLDFFGKSLAVAARRARIAVVLFLLLLLLLFFLLLILLLLLLPLSVFARPPRSQAREEERKEED